MTGERRIIAQEHAAVTCWQYHLGTQLLVYGTADGQVVAMRLDTGATVSSHFGGVVSVDFDLVQVTPGILQCVLGDYEDTVRLLTLRLSGTGITMTETELAPGWAVPNRTLITAQHLILIGNPLLIYERKGLKLLHTLEAGGEDTFKVGEVDPATGVLYVSTHSGRFFILDPAGGTLTPVLGVYADAFKIWAGLLVAGNNRAHTMTIADMAAPATILYTFDIVKADPAAEFPYPAPMLAAEYCVLPNAPGQFTFLRWAADGEDLEAFEVQEDSSLGPLVIGDQLLVAREVPLPAGVTPLPYESLNHGTLLELVPFIVPADE